MILLILSLLLLTANTLVIQVNNIHYGYRNVYTGKPKLSANILSMTQFSLSKVQLEQEDVKFIQITSGGLSIDTNELIRRFQIDEIDASEPILTYVYRQKQSIVLTLYAEGDEGDVEVLNELLAAGIESDL